MQTNINITKAFLETPDGVLSIHQISKKLKLPYGTAYNRVHALEKLDILQILPQGKAKLCALNPDNPMTGALLALGASQTTHSILGNNNPNASIARKILKIIKENSSNSLLVSILLTPDSLKHCSDVGEIMYIDNDESKEIPLDFFFITTSGETFSSEEIERNVSSLFPPGLPIKTTDMTVDKDTLLGMFGESENEAGLSAYQMLHEGIILTGFENFFNIVLEAFPRRLGA